MNFREHLAAVEPEPALEALVEADAMASRGDERAAMVHALCVLSDWVAEKAVARGMIPPTNTIRRLRDALDDLERGLTAPALKARVLNGKPPASACEKRLRTLAVIMVELLRNTKGLTHAKACAKVRRDLHIELSDATFLRHKTALETTWSGLASEDPTHATVEVESAAIYAEYLSGKLAGGQTLTAFYRALTEQGRRLVELADAGIR
jgi:hypothetical protein